MAIEGVVMCYARAAQAFSAGIKCQHCTSIMSLSAYVLDQQGRMSTDGL